MKTDQRKDRRGYPIGRRAHALNNPRKPLEPINWDLPIANWAERKFAEQMRKAGWKVTKKGWPDFICYKEKDGEERIVFVEIKPTRKYRLRAAQEKLFASLRALGLDVIIWSPDMGEPEL